MDSESQTQNHQFYHQPPPQHHHLQPPGMPHQQHQFHQINGAQNADPISGFSFNSSSGAQNLNSSSNLSGFQLDSSAAAAAAQNLNPSTNVSGFQLNSCGVAAVPDSNSSANLSGFQLNSSGVGNSGSAVHNPNSSSNLSGGLLNSAPAAAAQNPNPTSNVPGFQLNSSGVANSPPNSSSNPSGILINSSAVENSAAAGVTVSNGAGAMVKAAGVSVEQAKKKRGRPRKVATEGGNVGGGNGGDCSGGDPSAKRSRGRPAGAGKKHSDASGAGLTAHTLFVRAGEDISYKIMSFAQQGPHTVCILSASGVICNVTLRQAAMSGGNVTYEGRYEIVSLAGSFHPLENGSRAGALSVSLIGTDGNLVGGSVAGMLVAASPIQVIVASFAANTKKQNAKLPSAAPSSNILNFSAPASGMANSPSPDASSESTEENHDSPPDHGQGPHINAGQPMQQNMSMYSPMTWTNPIKMPPN